MSARALCIMSRRELSLDSRRNCRLLACHGVFDACGGLCCHVGCGSTSSSSRGNCSVCQEASPSSGRGCTAYCSATAARQPSGQGGGSVLLAAVALAQRIRSYRRPRTMRHRCVPLTGRMVPSQALPPRRRGRCCFRQPPSSAARHPSSKYRGALGCCQLVAAHAESCRVLAVAVYRRFDQSSELRATFRALSRCCQCRCTPLRRRQPRRRPTRSPLQRRRTIPVLMRSKGLPRLRHHVAVACLAA